jgi:ABC-2 type transport system ATP-binding protein
MVYTEIMAEATIVCDKLSKRYHGSQVYALKDLSLSVMPGEVYGFLGPNGAGKSTTIRLLMNFIQPSGGRATILGKDIVKDSVAIKHAVGYLSSDPGMYRKMTGQQFLDYMGELQPPASQAYRQELVRRLKAEPSKKLGDLSRGNRQKINIVQAFMHKPDILILDEPTTGLDPLMQEVFYELVAEAKARGATIFTSSHILSEVQKICDRVGIIREGRLIDEKSIAGMANEAAHTFDIVFAGKPPLGELRRLKGLELAGHDGGRVTVHVHGELKALFALLAKHDVSQLEARQLDLEETFMRFYSDGGKS